MEPSNIGRSFELEGLRMLTSQQKILRRLWYATTKLDELQQGPKPFKLLGENIVLFLERGSRRL